MERTKAQMREIFEKQRQERSSGFAQFAFTPRVDRVSPARTSPGHGPAPEGPYGGRGRGGPGGGDLLGPPPSHQRVGKMPMHAAELSNVGAETGWRFQSVRPTAK